jgi:hypothetical protein
MLRARLRAAGRLSPLFAVLVVAIGMTVSSPAAAWTFPQQGFLTFGGLTQQGTWPPSSTNNQFCME